ncbi:mitochondrial carrier protein [Colletotrichum plurivorum]|nr:mitochondrial carrier protein [Colletotrichum plurivorum]
MNEFQKADIRLWYRCLYRSALRAVQYSIPARFVVRDQLRAAFRNDGGVLNKEVAQRTNWFLHAAAKERGLEHKVLKNLVRIAYERNKQKQWRAAYIKDSSQQGKPLLQATKAFDATAYDHFDMTLAMLNKSMGLGLRCGLATVER